MLEKDESQWASKMKTPPSLLSNLTLAKEAFIFLLIH